VYVNLWEHGEKRLYTIYSALPEGHTGPLFELQDVATALEHERLSPEFHLVDLWHHEEITPIRQNGKTFIPVKIEAFDRRWLDSRREGNPGCVAVLKKQIKTSLEGKTLVFSARSGDTIRITPGNPSYATKQVKYPVNHDVSQIFDFSASNPEKIVVQLFQGTELIDETIVTMPPGQPVCISAPTMTPASARPSDGMVDIPAGRFRWYTKRDPSTLDPFIAFPDFSDTTEVRMDRFFIDRYPVTNGQFADFLHRSGYRPADTAGFLRHWSNGIPPVGLEEHPVVFVSPEDAKAYAEWAGKRLPTEQEWQYAAQGSDQRKYPWGNNMDSTRCNFNLNHTTSVNSFPSGESPFGVMDLVGNVWQITSDVYDNGSYYYTIIRGGSYYHPTQSIWYVTGGPLPVDHPEMLLLTSSGLNRNATVGFRCAATAIQEKTDR
jgi:formylglycine-generating enzyme required for sulfatase activity